MKPFALLLLAGMCMAQAKPAPKPAPDPPIINADYQSKFKTLVIQQQGIQLELKDLQAQATKDNTALQVINAKGLELEAQLMKDLGLNPAKWTVLYKNDTMVIIPKDEPKSEK